jgi:uncharacterized BrkB/YihY/UPF0761 family membrane protein
MSSECLNRKRNDIMKNRISMYWPLAVALPLAVAACLYVSSETASRIAQPPLGASQLTAELARTVSYGLVGNDPAMPVKAVRAVGSMQASQAS